MASGDVQLQSAVHSLDQGKFAFIIKVGMIVVILLAITLLYLFAQFKGLGNPHAMDQAQIARNIADGQGFTTKVIRPVALAIVKERSGSSEAVDVNRFPEFYQSPLNSWVNAIPLRLVKGSWKMTPSDMIYVGDRVIAATGILLFIFSVVVWYFVISRLFDTRIALVSCASMLVTDLFWQFSLSGLPQMLVLFLFSLASLATIFAMEASDEDQTTPTLGWLAGAGFLIGLMTLAHGLCFWVFLGWAIFVGIYFRPRAIVLLASFAAYLIVVSPWLVRNYQVSGTPFGLSIYDAFYDAAPEDSYQRLDEIDINKTGGSLKNKFRVNIIKQIEGMAGLLGLNIAAGAFFFSLLHAFRNRKAAMFKWCVLAMWVSALIGMSFFRGFTAVSENQIHVIFIPLFIAFGMAFLFVLWSRLEWGGDIMRIAFVSLIIFLCGVPMLLTLFAGQQSKIQWPPYVPQLISILGNWFKEDEVICADVPWAVAWYAQRTSLLMPQSLRSFNRIHDYNETKQPIRGLYLTPLTTNQRLFTEIYTGPEKEWAGLILRPPKTQDFPFTAFVPLPIEGQCILFADRDRWNNR